MPGIIQDLAQVELLFRQGHLREAEALCRELSQQAPREHAVWAWLGTIALYTNDARAAEAAFRRATMLRGDVASYWSNLAVAVQRQGRDADAERHLQQAISLEPTCSALWNNLAGCFNDQRRWTESLQAAQRALSLDPRNASALSNLGAAQHGLGNHALARQTLEQSLSLEPVRHSTLIRYAGVLLAQGHVGEAMGILQNELAQDPAAGAAWYYLGNAHVVRQNWDEAYQSYERAEQLMPATRDPLLGMAFIRFKQWQLVEAELLLRRLLEAESEHAPALSLLGLVLAKQARTDEAEIAFRRSKIAAATPVIHSAYLASLGYLEGITPAELLSEHRQWDATFARSLAGAVPAGAATRASGPLRIGLNSADFGRHPVGYLCLSALEALDKQACQIVCYSDRVAEDKLTARFRRAASAWRTTVGLSDQELADQICTDRIDVLIDLMGHTGPRLLMFARKPAAVQVSWLGYVGTTGLSAMDFLLADRFHVRPGEDVHYQEGVLRLPNGYACYTPPAEAPAVGPLPALKTGYVTFGCFNNPAKFSRGSFDGWAEILRAVPNSRLLFKYGGLHESMTMDRLREEFARRDIPTSRIAIEGWGDLGQLLAKYGEVDLALDTHPYSGGATTCDALWMGVPVVTHPGNTFASRHAVSHLTNAGYGRFVAADAAQYVKLAVDWAGRLHDLSEIRTTLRENVRRSRLCDANEFARDWLQTIRQAWMEKVG